MAGFSCRQRDLCFSAAVVVFYSCLYGFLRQYGAVELVGGEAVQGLCYRFVGELQHLAEGLALDEFGGHGAGCYGAAAAEGLEFYIGYDIIVDLEVDLHEEVYILS